MNDLPVIEPGEPHPRQGWVDAYLPDRSIAYQEPTTKLVELATVRGILFRQRWLLAGVLLTTVIAGLIITLLSTPLYEAKATVQVEPFSKDIVEGQDTDPGIASNQVFDFLQTQLAVIESRNVAKIVATNLRLHERSSLLGADFDEGRPPNLSDEQWTETRLNAVTEILVQSVDAELPNDTWIIEIGYSSTDPVIAAELANGYADAFSDSDTRDAVDDNEYAREYLLDQISQVRARLGLAERTSNDYARSTQIIVQPGAEDGAGGSTLTAANLSSINARVSDARARRIEAEQRWRAIENAPPAQLPEVQTNASMQGLINDKLAKQTELVGLRQRYNDDFPQIRNLLEEIRILDTQIQQSGNQIKATVRNEFIVARNQEQALQAELASLTNDTLAEKDDQVQLSVLERESEALRGELEALMFRYNQINSAANLESSAFTKLDSAIVPSSPYAPSLLRNLLISILLGSGLAGGLALVREIFDDRIRSLEDAEDKLGLPLLGHTPYVNERNVEVAGNEFSALMEAYASIRSSIDISLGRDRNVIQFTSTQASEGKSTTAVVLAELFARMGRKTLLIDADLRRPSIAKLLNLDPPESGLVEVILGHTSLEAAVIKGVRENLDVLALAAIPANPTEVLAESYLREFIAKHRNDYSLILFDSCPVMGLADAPMIAHVVDGTIFIMEANRTAFGKANMAKRRLVQGGAKIIGAVLTKFRALEAGHDYSYQYSYYQYGSD